MKKVENVDHDEEKSTWKAQVSPRTGNGGPRRWSRCPTPTSCGSPPGRKATSILAVDARGLPMSVILTAGQAGDNPQLLPLLDQIGVGRDGPEQRRSRLGPRGSGLNREKPSCFAVLVDHVPAAAQAARTARVSCGVACSGHGSRNLAAMMTRRSLTAMSS
jgi:hypothetical protein